jgi:hypothetical protein
MVGQSYVRVFAAVHEGPGNVVWRRTRDLPLRNATLPVDTAVTQTLAPIRDNIDAQIYRDLWQLERPA